MSKPKIRVKNASILEIHEFKKSQDGVPEDGSLFVPAMFNASLKPAPIVAGQEFHPKRFFFIKGVKNQKTIRGDHSHKTQSEVIVAVHGSCKAHLDDGTTKQVITLNDPHYALHIGPGLWHHFSNFSKDCILMVLANDKYIPSDYISKYEDFTETI